LCLEIIYFSSVTSGPQPLKLFSWWYLPGVRKYGHIFDPLLKMQEMRREKEGEKEKEGK
jgi:hypothetical protein